MTMRVRPDDDAMAVTPLPPSPPVDAQWPSTVVDIDFQLVTPAGASGAVTRAVANEAPVAIEINGLGYAVLMATPADLIDLAYGFALTERLIDGVEDIVEVVEHATDKGVVLRLFLAGHLADRALDRVRRRITDSSCGLCGIENLEQAMRPLPRLPRHRPPDRAALFRALAELRDHQPISRATGAVHAAALCGSDGAIMLAREDVGRHNAFDKLIGAMLRAGATWNDGFALLSSRCSYELVEKAVLAGCPFLATISAPTAMAINRAREAGLSLAALARPDAYLTR